MKSALLLSVSFIIVAINWPTWDAADGKTVVATVAGVVVGGLGGVAAAGVFTALGAPVIIVVLTGLMAGTLVGVPTGYWVHQYLSGSARHGGQGSGNPQPVSTHPQSTDQPEALLPPENPTPEPRRVANQIEIRFEPSSTDQTLAKPFQCTIVFIPEGDPQIIRGSDGDEFFKRLQQALDEWLAAQADGDDLEKPRRVYVSMEPCPGEPVFQRVKQLLEKNTIRKCIVNKRKPSAMAPTH
jgi:hypothetical protein